MFSQDEHDLNFDTYSHGVSTFHDGKLLAVTNVYHQQSKAHDHESHELGDVGTSTKVYINVEEVREIV
jgi:hypothetical protein